MSLCPSIWSIQLEFIPAFSRSVCSFFLRLWADILSSFTLTKACRNSVENECLDIRLTLPLFQVLNSGLSFVMVSGATFRETFLLVSMYSFNASIASFPMKVLANSFVFYVII